MSVSSWRHERPARHAFRFDNGMEFSQAPLMFGRQSLARGGVFVTMIFAHSILGVGHVGGARVDDAVDRLHRPGHVDDGARVFVGGCDVAVVKGGGLQNGHGPQRLGLKHGQAVALPVRCARFHVRFSRHAQTIGDRRPQAGRRRPEKSLSREISGLNPAARTSLTCDPASLRGRYHSVRFPARARPVPLPDGPANRAGPASEPAVPAPAVLRAQRVWPHSRRSPDTSPPSRRRRWYWP